MTPVEVYAHRNCFFMENSKILCVRKSKVAAGQSRLPALMYSTVPSVPGLRGRESDERNQKDQYGPRIRKKQVKKARRP